MDHTSRLGLCSGREHRLVQKNWSSQGLTMLVALSTGLLLAVSIGGMLPHGLSETPSQAPGSWSVCWPLSPFRGGIRSIAYLPKMKWKNTKVPSGVCYPGWGFMPILKGLPLVPVSMSIPALESRCYLHSCCIKSRKE